jgi:hypothetical protein
VIEDQPFFVSIQMLDDLGKFVSILNGIFHEQERNSILEFMDKIKKQMKTENVWKKMTKELHKICGTAIHRKSLGKTQSNVFRWNS